MKSDLTLLLTVAFREIKEVWRRMRPALEGRNEIGEVQGAAEETV
jgi:hypothetical protein